MSDNQGKSILGLDFGESRVKAVSIEREDGINKLLKYAVVPSKSMANDLFSDTDRYIDKVVDFMKEFILEHKFTDQYLSLTLPERLVFSKVITMPALSKKEFKQAVEWEAEQHLPKPLSEVYLKFEIVAENIKSASKSKTAKVEKIRESVTGHTSESTTGTYDVLIAAVPKAVINNVLAVIDKIKMTPRTIEPISMAIIRSVVHKRQNSPTIVINLGYNNTDFYLSVKNELRFVYTLNFGISSAISAVAKELNVSEIQANEYLFAYGLKENQLEGKIRGIVSPIVDVVIEELYKSQKYIERKEYLFGQSKEKRVKRVIVSGGGALIPDIMLYLIQRTSTEVQYANPWKDVDVGGIHKSKELEIFGPLFPGAVGVCLKDFD